MIDLETEYKNFENTWLSLGANFNNFSLGEDKMYHLSGEVKNLTDSEKILSLSCINTALAVWLIQAREKQLEIDSLKAQLEQAEKVWISTDFMLPDEDEVVLFMDKDNIIHDGFLITDYVDGPYGENGEDFGGDQTLWTSNSNGEEFLPIEIKYWMPRPQDLAVKVKAAQDNSHE